MTTQHSEHGLPGHADRRLNLVDACIVVSVMCLCVIIIKGLNSRSNQLAPALAASELRELLRVLVICYPTCVISLVIAGRSSQQRGRHMFLVWLLVSVLAIAGAVLVYFKVVAGGE